MLFGIKHYQDHLLLGIAICINEQSTKFCESMLPPLVKMYAMYKETRYPILITGNPFGLGSAREAREPSRVKAVRSQEEFSENSDAI